MPRRVVASVPRKYSVIAADPPWKLGDRLPDKRGAEHKYPCMTMAELKALPVASWSADNCALFMWRLSSMGEEAYALMRAWGFVPKTEYVWVKRTVNDKLNAGMGRYSYNSHETMLLGVKGRVIPPPILRSKSVFDARIGKHSQKPEEAYAIIDKMYPNVPKLEMFARCTGRPGWHFWGNEVKDDRCLVK